VRVGIDFDPVKALYKLGANEPDNAGRARHRPLIVLLTGTAA
jgi:hypothetical protein